MSQTHALHTAPEAFTQEEVDSLQASLKDVDDERARLLVTRYKVPDPSQAILDVVFSSMLLSNYLLIGSGSGRIVKLIDIVGVGGRIKDVQSYAIVNYGRALLSGGYASFNNLEHWCHMLGLDVGNNIMGMNRFSDVAHFLKTCSTQVLASHDLEVAEASLSIGGLFDGDTRFRPFEIVQRSSLVSEISCADTKLPVAFDQVSDFDYVIVRSSKSRDIVQMDMDLTNMQKFLDSFTQATNHLCDLNFMRGHSPKDLLRKPYL